MKRTSILIILGLTMGSLLSCSGGSKETKAEDSEPSIIDKVSETAGVKNLSSLEDKVKDMEKVIKELKSQTPVSNEVLKAVLPESLGGLKRKEFAVGDASVLNIKSAKAKYEDVDERKKLKLEILDGAGETASAMFSMVFMALKMDREKETDTGFEKVVDFKDGRAVIKQNKDDNNVESEIEWLFKDRFIIKLEGDGFTYEELMGIANNLNLSNLGNNR